MRMVRVCIRARTHGTFISTGIEYVWVGILLIIASIIKNIVVLGGIAVVTPYVVRAIGCLDPI
jgi:hypothetical protein